MTTDTIRAADRGLLGTLVRPVDWLLRLLLSGLWRMIVSCSDAIGLSAWLRACAGYYPIAGNLTLIQIEPRKSGATIANDSWPVTLFLVNLPDVLGKGEFIEIHLERKQYTEVGLDPSDDRSILARSITISVHVESIEHIHVADIRQEPKRRISGSVGYDTYTKLLEVLHNEYNDRRYRFEPDKKDVMRSWGGEIVIDHNDVDKRYRRC